MLGTRIFLEIVGYSMGGRMTKHLVMESLQGGLVARRPLPGLIHHSDRGSQYCALEYASLLDHCRMAASMGRKGNCCDNAPRESFRGILKGELIYHCRHETRQEAMRDITEYIEVFYNRLGKQAKPGLLSPTAFERRFHEKQPAP